VFQHFRHRQNRDFRALWVAKDLKQKVPPKVMLIQPGFYLAMEIAITKLSKYFFCDFLHTLLFYILHAVLTRNCWKLSVEKIEILNGNLNLLSSLLVKSKKSRFCSNCAQCHSLLFHGFPIFGYKIYWEYEVIWRLVM